MIGLPLNDLGCLGSITETVVSLVAARDPAIAEVAATHATTAELAAWIRTLPQRDDNGDPTDGPREPACEPSQRLRIPAANPNCVERAALYLAVAELIDPGPTRQLATLDTPIGLHTFPLENGAPVILDPRVPRNCIAGGLVLDLGEQAPLAVDARAAVDLVAQLADAGAAHLRNGPSRARRARNAILGLVEEGAAPADDATLDAIGWFFAIAERKARELGARALGIVQTVALGVADLADEAVARTQRNLALDLGNMRLESAPWLSGLMNVAARIGLDVGAVALRGKLGALGITGEMLGLVEDELNTEGLTLGPLARPGKLATFASLANKPTN